MALFDAVNQGRLSAGLLGLGAGLLQGSTGNYGQFGPALGQGFALAGHSMNQHDQNQMRQQAFGLHQQQAQQEQMQQQQARRWWAQNGGNLTPQTMQAGIGTGNPYLADMIKNAAGLQPKPEGPTTLMRNLNAAGLIPGTPEYQAAIMSGIKSPSTTVNVGGDSAPGLGKLSPDYGYVLDPATGMPVIDQNTGLPTAAPVPGSPAYYERQEAVGQAQSAIDDAGRMIATIDAVAGHRGLDQAVGPYIGEVRPVTPDAKDFSVKLSQLQGQVFLDAYQKLKGGGAITDFEGQKAEQALAALGRAQSPEQFRSALSDLREVVESAQNRLKSRLPSARTPAPAAIEHLRSNPNLRGAFDAKYGSGAAARILGQ